MEIKFFQSPMEIKSVPQCRITFLNLCKRLGIFPFSETGQLNKISLILVCLIAAHQTTICLMWIVIYVYPQWVYGHSDLSRIYKIVEGTSIVIVYLFQVISYIRNREKFTKIIVHMSPKKISIIEHIMMSSILLTGFPYLLALLENHAGFLIRLNGILTYSFGLSTQIQFVGLITEVTRRFTQITPHMQGPKNYEEMRKRFDLFALSKTIIDLYKWQILIFAILTLASLVNTFHGLIIALMERSHIFALLGSMKLAGSLIQQIIVVHACEQLKVKANAFNVELFRLMRKNWDLCRDKKLFLYLTLKQTIKFTACGFFNVEYPLVTSIIGAATTYLVILLQFDMPGDLKKE